jgi:hypothetical protein
MQGTIKTSKYNSAVYSSLSDFVTAKKYSYTSLDILLELGKIICKYSLHKHIGLCLLHKHFEIDQDEVLVRKIINNAALTSPQTCPQSGLISYMWKIGKTCNDNRTVFFPLEFVLKTATEPYFNTINRIQKRLHSNSNFIQEFSRQLYEFNLSDAFGISILNKCFLNKKEDETFLETTDELERSLNLSPAKKNIISEEMIQTQWAFDINLAFADNACSHCGHTDNGSHCFHGNIGNQSTAVLA